MSRRPRPTPPPPPPDEPETKHLFLNRELSWLAFNERVLAETCDKAVPLGERFKFQSIVASNLDEFFMVRVAGLKQALAGSVVETGADGLLPAEQLSAIASRAQAMVSTLYRNWRDEIAPGLGAAGLAILRPGQLAAEQRAFLEGRFRRDVWPVLTPLAVDQGHPFPVLRNRSLNLAILLYKERQRVNRRQAIFAVVQVPSVLPRLVEVPAVAPCKAAFVLLEDVIAMHVGDLFPGFRVIGCSPFRVTRNFDLSIDEDEADDLLQTIQKELRKRERGQAVRLEITADTAPEVEGLLREALRLERDDVYAVDGPLHLADLSPLYGRDELWSHKDDPFLPQMAAPLCDAPDLFRAIGERDVLLHHPYESFEHVVEFIAEAASDPAVLAIKQTLYRTSVDSPIIRALIRAAENGKQVTAVVELKARFDEGPNIAWARVLEEAGVHVVYGLVGLKTHCKMSLVVRREAGAIKRYVHMSTGNYNPSTARLYGDISFFTAREAFADDAGALFNFLTGYATPPSWKRFSVAPAGLHDRIIELIDREASFGAKGRIIAKMNSLVDPQVIRALYRASQAGAKIDLLVRGICCLRPGVPGVSDNIQVTSVVDRFLEHARIFYFEAGGKREVFLSSADWMPRNFVRRVEIMFPIEDEGLRDRLVNEVLATMLCDNVKAWRLQPDGFYLRLGTGDQLPLRSQHRFVELAREKALAAEATTPVASYRARAVPRARGPAPEAVWSVTSPGAPTGGDRMAS
ncbi:MAG TPA: polyphosphate kinase 1 [Polyangia bacterium]|nr:polyphosphate kinase 1 [Polyangia bacterium]